MITADDKDVAEPEVFTKLTEGKLKQASM